MKKGLGKGLSALFEEPRAEVKESSAEQEEHGQAREISINFIEPGKGQPRQDFPEEALKELAESIKIHGILQPLAVRETKNSRYEIIAGERRWRQSLRGLKKSQWSLRILTTNKQEKRHWSKTFNAKT